MADEQRSFTEMWIMTTDGFYSVVQKPGERDLTVRARVPKDLENLRMNYLPSLKDIRKDVGTDYRYRAEVSHEDFAATARKTVLDINYSNFKNSITKIQGSKRAKTYGKVWEALLEIEREEEL